MVCSITSNMRNALIVTFFTVSISLFILIMCNYSSSETLFTLRNSTALRSLVQHSTEMNKTRIKDTVYSEQFVTHGKWMPGKRHNQTCDFIPKTVCHKKDPNLHFQFYDNKLNKLDAVAELRKILKNKKMLLIGDSLMTEFFFGLAELLQVKTKEPKYDCKLNFTLHPGNNSTLTHIKACMIVLTGYESFANWHKLKFVPEEKIRTAITDYDVILFNQGLHYDKLTLMCQSAVYFNNLGKMLYGKNFFKHFGPYLFSGNVYPGFQCQGEFPHFPALLSLCDGFLRLSCSATPEHLLGRQTFFTHFVWFLCIALN